MTKVSVVVPVYNEEGNVAELHREIKEVCEKNQYEYEIIFVNDGSSDRTEEVNFFIIVSFLCFRQPDTTSKSFSSRYCIIIGMSAGSFCRKKKEIAKCQKHLS